MLFGDQREGDIWEKFQKERIEQAIRLSRWYNGKEYACQCRRCRRLGFDPWVGRISLQEAMVTHSSILVWRIPRTEEPERLSSMGSQRVRHNWACARIHISTPGTLGATTVWAGETVSAKTLRWECVRHLTGTARRGWQGEGGISKREEQWQRAEKTWAIVQIWASSLAWMGSHGKVLSRGGRWSDLDFQRVSLALCWEQTVW